MNTDIILFDGVTYRSACVTVTDSKDMQHTVRTASVQLERELTKHIRLLGQLSYEASLIDREIDIYVDDEDYDLEEEDFIAMLERSYYGKSTIN